MKKTIALLLAAVMLLSLLAACSKTEDVYKRQHVDRVPEAEAAALGAMTAAERDALIRLTGRYRALFAQKLN